MTKDPKRWLDPEGGATELERRLIAAASEEHAHDAEKRAIWAGLAAKLPPIGRAAGAGTAGAAAAKGGAAAAVKTIFGSAVLKTTLILVVSASAAAVTARAMIEAAAPEPSLARIHRDLAVPQEALEPDPDPAPAPAIVAEPPSPIEPSAPPKPRRVEAVIVRAREPDSMSPRERSKDAEPDPTPALERIEPLERSAHRDDAVPLTSSAAKSRIESHLREESRLIEDARSRLRVGDAGGALEILRRAEDRFPRGVLEEERHALLVEALAASGEDAAAHDEAIRFLADHAESPYAARVRALDARR